MGGVQPNLNLEKVRSLAVPLCPTGEALALGHAVGAALNRVSRLSQTTPSSTARPSGGVASVAPRPFDNRSVVRTMHAMSSENTKEFQQAMWGTTASLGPGPLAGVPRVVVPVTGDQLEQASKQCRDGVPTFSTRPDPEMLRQRVD
jgi:hypothetical protein